MQEILFDIFFLILSFLLFLFVGSFLSFDNIILEIMLYLIILNLTIFFGLPLRLLFYKKIESKRIKKYEVKFNQETFETFRDKVKEYSPAIMSYCMQKKINFEDDLMAAIVSLKLRGYLDIIENKLIRLEKPGESLNNNEIYILNNLNNISEKICKTKNSSGETYYYYFIDEFKDEWKESIFKDLEKENFCIKRQSLTNTTTTITLIQVITMISLLIFLPAFNEYLDAVYIKYGIILFITNFISLLGIMSMREKISYDYKYVRTKKGLELGAQMQGLKKFILEFTNLSDSNIGELFSWDYYIVYAILFNKEGKLDKEMDKLYDNILK